MNVLTSFSPVCKRSEFLFEIIDFLRLASFIPRGILLFLYYF